MTRIALAALALSLCAGPLCAQDVEPVDYGVKPGDQVETTFYTAGGEALGSVQGQRLVDREGNIFFPYVGTVHVQGLDAAEIRTLLAQKFEPFYKDPVITVDVKLKVNITGVVGAAGHYLLDPTTTIVDALSTAGGSGFEVSIGNNVAADIANVRLVRDGETILLDLRPQVADPRPLTMRVQSGDWIHVPPQARSRVRDDISFYGGLMSLVVSVFGVIALVR
jgi:polysaccharide biosynthesis/export protein